MSAATPVAEQRQAPTVRADVPARAWDEYAASRKDSSVYHLAAWADLITRVFGHRTRYLAAYHEHRIVGILPLVLFNTPLFGRFATSMPFVNYGGIVADTREAAHALLAAAIHETQTARGAYLELRHTRRMFERSPVQAHKVEMVLALQPTVDEQWRVLDRKLRNQIRKAEKSGLTVRRGGRELLDRFHGVLAHNLRDLGSPVHSKRFFADILATFPDRTQLLCVSLGSKPVAASFMIWNGAEIEVPWASALRAYNPMCPNVLLYWEMLRFSIERRFARFDFGRSTPDGGTFTFKKQWGAEAKPLYWEYWLDEGRSLPDRSPKNPKFTAMISVWRRLPLAVTRAIGPMIVRGIP
ncbi:MAG: FemAB family XrtA/PEP-CTERM system-associated protein [Acidobacteriota bacterium]